MSTHFLASFLNKLNFSISLRLRGKEFQREVPRKQKLLAVTDRLCFGTNILPFLESLHKCSAKYFGSICCRILKICRSVWKAISCWIGCSKKSKFLVWKSTTHQGLCMYVLSHQKKFQNFRSKIEPLRPILSFRIFGRFLQVSHFLKWLCSNEYLAKFFPIFWYVGFLYNKNWLY